MPRYRKVGVFYDRPGHPTIHGELTLAIDHVRSISRGNGVPYDRPVVTLDAEELFKVVALDEMDDMDVQVRFAELSADAAEVIWEEAVEEALGATS